MLYSPKVRPTSLSFQYARLIFGLRTSLPQTNWPWGQPPVLAL